MVIRFSLDHHPLNRGRYILLTLPFSSCSKHLEWGDIILSVSSSCYFCFGFDSSHTHLKISPSWCSFPIVLVLLQVFVFLYVFDVTQEKTIHENVQSFANLWSYCVVIITVAKLHSRKSELRFTVSNPVHIVSEVYDNENLWQWSRLGIHFTETIHYYQFLGEFRLFRVSNGAILLGGYNFFVRYASKYHKLNSFAEK